VALQTITFDESRFSTAVGVILCSASQANTFDDRPTTGTRFVIAQGTMFITSGGDRRLAFSRFDNGTSCPEPTNGVLLILFDVPQVFAQFNLGSDFIGDGGAPIQVRFFSQLGGTTGNTPVNVVDTRSFDFPIPNPVIYDNPAVSIRAIEITVRATENLIDNLSFSDTPLAAQRDVAVAFDGSGSMAAQNKWGAMIEAGDLFADVYTELGNASDTFGGVLFRWDCAQITTGSQIVNRPAPAALSSGVDIPTLFAGDSPQGCTPIGEGLITAAGMVNAGSNATKAILLLTDGINNRGRSVDVASADASLSNVAVHTLGLGSGGAIDPVAISALSAAHNGTFRQTNDPAEVLDFFVQSLGQILGKAELAVVAPDDSVVIAPGTTKAIFLIASTPGTAPGDFDLRDPNGAVISHTAPPAGFRYVAAGTTSFHAFFVVTGTDLGGTWAFVGAAATARRLAIEDLALRIQWSIDPKLGVTGDSIVVRARITYQGKPFTGKARVSAIVTSPSTSTGHLLAQGGRKAPATSGGAPDRNIRALVAAAGLKAAKLTDFPVTRSKSQAFKSLGKGVYELTYTKTAEDGVYRFDLIAEGLDRKFRFQRRITLFSVLVSDVAKSNATVKSHSKGLYLATVRPMRADKALVGPFLASKLTFQTTLGQFTGATKDHLDGSYSRLLAHSGKGKPKVSVSILDVSSGTGPGGKGRKR
jgi:hypothetical protein